MRALTFSLRALRLAAAKLLGAFSPRGYLSALGPVGLREVPEPERRGDDWLIVATRRAGICGSDLKEVFLEGALDNPLTAVITFPHIMGHEVAGEVVEVGPAVEGLAPGERVIVYPWLTCEPRGLPLCDACRAGELTTCRRLADGPFAPGMHYGTCRDVGGAFAPRLAAHASMCFRVPEGVSFDAAVLADPFAVCLRALQKAPPAPGETVLVLGCGALGTMLLHLLARLRPDVTVWAVDRLEALGERARGLGAARFTSAGGAALVETVADWVGARPHRPWSGLPWLLDGVDRVYDLVGSARTLEVALRVVRAQGTVVLVGVSKPARFEWTPLYFKEVAVVGSNGAGVEAFEGRREHAFALYLELLEGGRLAPEALVTHHFPLEAYREAFLTARDKARTGAVKVVFDL